MLVTLGYSQPLTLCRPSRTRANCVCVEALSTSWNWKSTARVKLHCRSLLIGTSNSNGFVAAHDRVQHRFPTFSSSKPLPQHAKQLDVALVVVLHVIVFPPTTLLVELTKPQLLLRKLIWSSISEDMLTTFLRSDIQAVSTSLRHPDNTHASWTQLHRPQLGLPGTTSSQTTSAPSVPCNASVA